MNRYATALVGGLMGLATGLMFVHPISAFFGPTTVTWDASNCPTGTYTITSTARAIGATKAYSVMTTNVSLPKATVVQQLQDLPAGTYKVSAVATPSSGTTYQSEFVTVNGGGEGGVVFGRSRPPSNPVLGTAKSRNQPADATPTPPPTDRRLAPTAAPPSAPAAGSTMPPSIGVPEFQIRQLLALLADTADGADRQWRRVDAVDEDADGLFDYVAVESISGEIWIYRFHGA